MWLLRHEERVRLGCVKESLLDFIYHAHEVLREFKWRLVVCVCVGGGVYQDLPKVWVFQHPTRVCAPKQGTLMVLTLAKL